MCVIESVKTQGNWKLNKFSRVAREKPSREVKHVFSTWLECEESWQMVTAGFRECLAGKAFPQNTRETFCFANLSYLIRPVSAHTIYTHITHICWGVLFIEKTLAQLLRVRDCHTHNSLYNLLWFSLTPTSPYPNPWEVDSSNTYHTHHKCKVRFWYCWEALEEAICLVDTIGLNCVIQRVREDKAWWSQLVVGVWRARVHVID